MGTPSIEEPKKPLFYEGFFGSGASRVLNCCVSIDRAALTVHYGRRGTLLYWGDGRWRSGA